MDAYSERGGCPPCPACRGAMVFNTPSDRFHIGLERKRGFHDHSDPTPFDTSNDVCKITKVHKTPKAEAERGGTSHACCTSSTSLPSGVQLGMTRPKTLW